MLELLWNFGSVIPLQDHPHKQQKHESTRPPYLDVDQLIFFIVLVYPIKFSEINVLIILASDSFAQELLVIEISVNWDGDFVQSVKHSHKLISFVL